MDTDRWQRVKEIFKAAIELGPEKRRAFLDEACRSDPDLLAEVKALLESDAGSGDFLETPIQTGEERVGGRIGGYVLKRLISSGGMGTVYEALQEHPHRTVAVKVMKAGIASRSALRRFEYESQILARLRHPGIAQVIEAGTHRKEGAAAEAGGVPYFVMEYIPDALAITDYAREKNLAARERLRLFGQVCDAVHHGHQKGIIHRDLKPSNILVDRQGKAKIIDFGVARATDSDMALTTVHTEVGQLIGTLQYMSPEQCKADPDDLDIRSDVYSLGVVLYELLCGTVPYNVRNTAVIEAARLIREEPPKRPSTVDRALRGDVETIVLKALEKDRRRRYQTMAAFGGDVRRYLDGEVILAKPAGPVTRTVKVIKRNPVVSTAVAVALLAFVAIFINIVFWSLPRIREEMDKTREASEEATKAWKEARSEAEKAKTINRFLERMLSSPDPGKLGKDVKVVDVLAKAEGDIDKHFKDQPEIEASLRRTLGWTYLKLGLFELAERHLQAAADIHGRVKGKEHSETLTSMEKLAAALCSRGKLSEAGPILREVVRVRRRTLGKEHPTILGPLNTLGIVLHNSGDLVGAESAFSEILEMGDRVLGKDHPNLLRTMNNLAAVLSDQGKDSEAEPVLRKIADAGRRIKGPEHPMTLGALNNLASVLRHQSKFSEAEAILREVLHVRNRTLGSEHPETLCSNGNIAGLLRGQDKFLEAEAIYRKTLEIRRRTLRSEHPDIFNSMNDLACVLGDQGRFAEAESIAKEVVAFRRDSQGMEHPATLSSMTCLANVLFEWGKLGEAEPIYRQVLEIRVRVLGEEHPDTITTMNCLADLLVSQGRLSEALPLLEKGFDDAAALPEGHQSKLFLHLVYAKCLAGLERYTEAEEHLLKAYSGFAVSFGEDNSRTHQALSCLVDLYDAWGKADKAAEWRARLPADEGE